MAHIVVIATAAVLLALTVTIESANILFLYPIGSPSHKNVALPIITGLADRGHNVTVVSSYPSKHPKVRDIHPFKNFDYFPPDTTVMDHRQKGIWGMIFMNYDPILKFCDELYKSKEVLGLLKEKFDLVLIDTFGNECALGIVYKLGAPLIPISPLVLPHHVSLNVGNRLPPSFTPHIFSTYGDQMNFWERVVNFIINLGSYYAVRWPFQTHEEIYRKYLGQDLPGVDEVLGNSSMIFSNSHFTFTLPRPVLPDVVEIGASHCRPGKPLPEDLKSFLDDAKDGAILFSLGSIVRPHEMPEATRDAFVNVFSRLKQKVLWKWPADIPNLPKNVNLVPWIPQQDVLAHPNVHLFMTHAGLLSTQESIYHGVPMIGIPVFADQDLNAHQAQRMGIAIYVEIQGLTEAALESAINKVLTDKGYSERVAKVSEYMRDQPETPQERAVFWAEYVIRHKGAKHLQSAARNLDFFQYYCLDVVAVLLAGIFGILLGIYLTIKTLLKYGKRLCSSKVSKAKKTR